MNFGGDLSDGWVTELTKISKVELVLDPPGISESSQRVCKDCWGGKGSGGIYFARAWDLLAKQ